MFVPVKSQKGKQLMPTTPPVARHLIKSGKATPYWNNGCILYSFELRNDRIYPRDRRRCRPWVVRKRVSRSNQRHTLTSMFKQMRTAKSTRKLKSVVSCVEVGVHESVRTAKTEPIALRTKNAFPQARVSGGTGNFGYFIGCLNFIRLPMYV